MRHFVLNADQHGKLQAAIEMEGDAKGYELSVSVRSLKDGKEMYTQGHKPTVSHQIKDSNKEQLMEGNWMNIQPWSTEDPNLYVARLELKDPKGKRCKAVKRGVRFPHH